MDAALLLLALLLLALLGHAAVWVALVNRLHAAGLPQWLIETGAACCFLMLAAIPVGCGWWCLQAGPEVFARLHAGQLLRAAPVGVLLYLILCWAAAARTVFAWVRRHAWRRPPDVLRFDRVRSLLHRRRPAPTAAEHPHHFIVRLPGNQSLHLDLAEREIEVPRLPPALDGLSLVHLSDFHFTGLVGKPYFQEIVRLSNELRPDLVALTGDLVDHDRCIDWIPDTLGRLAARYGVYCVLGNHDAWCDVPRLIRVLEQSGICHLGGRHVQIEIAGVPVVLAGNELPWLAPAADLEHCLPPSRGGPFRILLAHSPDQLPWAQAHDADLLLAGHMHGGQIRLPLVGPIFAPSRLGVKYASGVFHAPPTIMHVTRGISGRLPLRMNCAPEMARLVLHPRGQGTGI
jgi:hypothetical protein